MKRLSKILLLTTLLLSPQVYASAHGDVELSSGQKKEKQVVSRGTYQYYKIYAHAGDTVKVDLTDMDANANLYVRVGLQASKERSDRKSVNGGHSHNPMNESCSVPVNKDSYVYIAVHAPLYGSYSKVKHSIKASIIRPNNTTRLRSGEPIVRTVDKGKYKYYKIKADAGDTVKVDLYDMDANGNLYVRVGSQASKERSDCKSVKGGHTHSAIPDSCSVSVNKNGYVYIAVYAPTDGCNNFVEHTIMASVSSGGGDDYGKAGKYEMRMKENKNREYTYYYPKDIANMRPKPPLIFMVPGGNGNTAKGYTTLIKFMVSHGNAVLASKSSYGAYHIIDRLEKGIIDLAINNEVDTTKIGVFGHSTGGAHAFNVLKHFSDKEKYGSNGRFIYSFDPYHIQGMHENELQALPTNTNVIMFQSTKDGKSPGPGESPRIPLKTYSLLTSIPSDQKDYQVYDEKQGHHYIEDNHIVGESFKDRVANIQHVLKPLDALMAYTFNGVSSAKSIALGVGSDHPISDGMVELDKLNENGDSVVFTKNSNCRVTGEDKENYHINSCKPTGL